MKMVELVKEAVYVPCTGSSSIGSNAGAAPGNGMGRGFVNLCCSG